MRAHSILLSALLSQHFVRGVQNSPPAFRAPHGVGAIPPYNNATSTTPWVSPTPIAYSPIPVSASTPSSVKSSSPPYPMSTQNATCDPSSNTPLPQSCLVTVNLGYSVYQGYYNATSDLDLFLGIRYAAPPTGQNRWRKPQAPATNRTQTIPALEYPWRCPQSGNSPYLFDPCPNIDNVDELPERCANSTAFQEDILGNEDCLFLSVTKPHNVTAPLPVLVWIHGGGYGQGQGNQNLSDIINANNNSFVGVAIQYRLGAFGFLSSDEVYRFGTVNAGLLDQHFALKWVQDHIDKFGGDKNRVTIAGESAGAGSVMLQDMAYGGTQGDSLFVQTIAASPYLPMQYGYADFVPTQSYFSFAAKVGCFTGNPYGNSSESVLECLRRKDTLLLQQASAITSGTGLFGTWGFLPVTDNDFVRDLPSIQLTKKRQVNGQRALIGNNANEGAPFTPQNIITENDFEAYINQTFPLFTNEDFEKLLYYYASSSEPVDPSAPLFATTGTGEPTAINQSTFGTGQQQRADNIYAETTFVCPSYWMAEAYSDQAGRASYHYQFSVPPSQHGADVAGYFGPRPVTNSPDFEFAFMKIWGNFVVTGDPSISSEIANGISTGNMTVNAVSTWPKYSVAQPLQVNLNQTGGTPQTAFYNVTALQLNISYTSEPGLQNDLTVVNAYTWEGGRGRRCDFWKEVGQRVPE